MHSGINDSMTDSRLQYRELLIMRDDDSLRNSRNHRLYLQHNKKRTSHTHTHTVTYFVVIHVALRVHGRVGGFVFVVVVFF